MLFLYTHPPPTHTPVNSPKLAHTPHTKPYAKGKANTSSESCPLQTWIVSAYIAVGSIQSCVLFLKKKKKKKKKREKHLWIPNRLLFLLKRTLQKTLIQLFHEFKYLHCPVVRIHFISLRASELLNIINI